MRNGLPADVELEKLVLGAAMAHGLESARQIFSELGPADFSTSSHALIAEKIAANLAIGEQVDRVSILRGLQAAQLLEAVGGISYLISLDEGLPQLYSLASYVRSLREKSIMRQAVLACHTTIDSLCAPGAGLAQVEAAERILRDLNVASAPRDELRPAAEFIGTGAEAEAFLNPALSQPGYMTGWRDLDRLTGGIKPGQIWILAARPAVGKSTFAAQLAERVAGNGIPASLFSLEMPATLILRRLAASRAEVPFDRWAAGETTAAERRALAAATFEISKLPLALSERPRTTLGAIQAAIVRKQARGALALGVIDYIQLVSASERRIQNRNEEIGAVSRGLKMLALELNIAILALSQLTRDNERENRPPRLSDLRDSGSLEQDADAVVFLHPIEKDGSKVEVRVAKNRVGPIGKFTLQFEKHIGRFQEPIPAVIHEP